MSDNIAMIDGQNGRNFEPRSGFQLAKWRKIIRRSRIPINADRIEELKKMWIDVGRYEIEI